MIDKRNVKITRVLKELKKEKINTWFDLGLFIDKFREEKLHQLLKATLIHLTLI